MIIIAIPNSPNSTLHHSGQDWRIQGRYKGWSRRHMFAQWPYQFTTVTGFSAWYARRPCCNMRNLQRLWRHGVTTSYHLTLDIFQQVLASRPMFSCLECCLRITAHKSLPPAGRRKQSENDDQCIGTFGQSRSPDSRGCLRVWLAVDGPGWLIYHDISCPPDATNI